MADRAPDNQELHCKICGLKKKRIREGTYKKKVGKTPKWKGEDGLLWNGLTCGECHRKQTAVRMTIKRALEE
jgi:hypothetical protein